MRSFSRQIASNLSGQLFAQSSNCLCPGGDTDSDRWLVGCEATPRQMPTLGRVKKRFLAQAQGGQPRLYVVSVETNNRGRQGSDFSTSNAGQKQEPYRSDPHLHASGIARRTRALACLFITPGARQPLCLTRTEASTRLRYSPPSARPSARKDFFPKFTP